jgi:hypothetical protein
MGYLAYLLLGLLIGLTSVLIYRQVKEYHLQDDPMLHTLIEVLRPITYEGKSIVDGMKLYKGDKSYTLNKNQTFLCLNDKNGQYYPLQMLVYVTLHERAHSLNTKDVGHTPEFYRVFQILLDQATALGIYDPNIPVIKDYCE